MKTLKNNLPKIVLMLVVAQAAIIGCKPDEACPTGTCPPTRTSPAVPTAPRMTNEQIWFQRGVEAATEANRAAITAISEESRRLADERSQNMDRLLESHQATNETMLEQFFQRVQQREASQLETQQQVYGLIERTSRATVDVLADRLSVADEQQRLERAAGHDRLLTVLLMQPLYVLAPLLIIAGLLLVMYQRVRRHDQALMFRENDLRIARLQQATLDELHALEVPVEVTRRLQSFDLLA